MACREDADSGLQLCLLSNPVFDSYCVSMGEVVDGNVHEEIMSGLVIGLECEKSARILTVHLYKRYVAVCQ